MFTGVFTPGLLMILQAYYGENKVLSVLIFTLALTLNGAVTGGYLGNGLDIAPNFSGIIITRTIIIKLSNGIKTMRLRCRYNIWNGQHPIVFRRILVVAHSGKTYQQQRE